MVWRVPSKTFLVGEYIALKGYPSLVLTGSPFFTGQAAKVGNVHPKSPAGRLLAGTGYELSFFDPHEGRGGFGASTAQFLMAYRLTQSVDGWSHLLKTYLELFSDQHRPSGMDLVAQSIGGIVHCSPHLATSYRWPFRDLRPVIVPTGFKIPTHSHLESLDTTRIDYKLLEHLAKKAIKAFIDSEPRGFALALQSYGESLEGMGFLAPETKDFIFSIKKDFQGIQAAKGCGAFGVDTALFLLPLDRVRPFYQLLERKDFSKIYGL